MDDAKQQKHKQEEEEEVRLERGGRERNRIRLYSRDLGKHSKAQKA